MYPGEDSKVLHGDKNIGAPSDWGTFISRPKLLPQIALVIKQSKIRGPE